MNAIYSYPTRIKLLVVGLFVVAGIRAGAQMIPVSLNQRIDQSLTIFEGKVIAQQSFFDEGSTHIYTVNRVTVYKVFKGNITSEQVEIITEGGVVGNRMEQVTPSLQLQVGDVGAFTTIPNTVQLSVRSGLMRTAAYAGEQGFIRYNLADGSASDPFNHYPKVTTGVYSAIMNRTRAKVMTINKADFKVK